MNESGTFTITNNYLNQHLLPEAGWDYSTFGYGFGITFWSRLEVNYVCTLFWGDWSPKAQGPNGTYRQKIMKNQDRHFAAKVLLLKEEEIWSWTPSIAVGISDPIPVRFRQDSSDVFKSLLKHNGRLHVNRIFNSITYILPTGNEKDCWLVDCGDVEKVIEQGWNVKHQRGNDITRFAIRGLPGAYDSFYASFLVKTVHDDRKTTKMQLVLQTLL